MAPRPNGHPQAGPPGVHEWMSEMRVLVVEDDPKAAAYLRKGLMELGFVIDVAANGIDGGHLAVTCEYDAVILDVNLPGADGWTVLRGIRQHRPTPVLFLTARDRIEDRVRGLDLGGDDYLVKPFAFSELVARLRSIMRRSAPIEPAVLRVADLQVDPLRRKVRRADARIDLTPKEFALLHLLARHHGEVLNRTRIAEQVWDMNYDSDTNVVYVAVRRLRAKVDEPFPVRLIHTIRGVGYVLEERG